MSETELFPKIMHHNKVFSPGNMVHVAKYKHMSGFPEAKEVTHMLCVELVPQGSGTFVPQTFAIIGDTSKSSFH